jgi:hypothetical protein
MSKCIVSKKSYNILYFKIDKVHLLSCHFGGRATVNAGVTHTSGQLTLRKFRCSENRADNQTIKQINCTVSRSREVAGPVRFRCQPITRAHMANPIYRPLTALMCIANGSDHSGPAHLTWRRFPWFLFSFPVFLGFLLFAFMFSVSVFYFLKFKQF